VIIAVDGASTDLSLALAEPDGTILADDAWSSAQRQSAELLPRLLALVASADRSLGDLRAVAVGTGPGSFTGLRVAMAIAKGVSLGLGRPIFGVASLPAWLEAEPDAMAAVARAGSREAYLLARGEEQPRIVDRDELNATDPLVTSADLATAFGLADARPPHAAPAIARRAAERLAQDSAGDDLALLEPLYLRAPRGVSTESPERVRWL